MPTFYKELLKIWLSIKNKNPGLTPNNSAQYLWNNELFTYKGKTIFNDKWIKKDILFLTDIVSNNNILSDKQVQEKVGGNVLTLFEFNAIKNASKSVIDDGNIYKDRDFTIYLDNTPIQNITVKEIRKILCNKKTSEKAVLSTHIWKKKFGDSKVDENAWLLPSKATSETQLIALQWKILHNIFPTKILLKKMKLEDSDICESCNTIETIEHFFFHCKKINFIWEQINKDIIILIEQNFKIKEEQVILGISDITASKLKLSQKHYLHANLMILVAKNCISKYRYGSHPNLKLLYEFEMQWRMQIEIEKNQ